MSLIDDARSVGGIYTTISRNFSASEEAGIALREPQLAALKALWIGKIQQEPEAWHIPNSTEVTKSLDCKQPPYEPLYTHPQPQMARGEVVVTLDHEIPSKITVGDYVLWEAPAYEPQSYWEICYAACWGGRFKSEYDALEDDGREGMRSIREVKPTDEHYKPAWRSKPELTFIRYSLAEINKETKP